MIRIVNVGEMTFPITACVEPFKVSSKTADSRHAANTVNPQDVYSPFFV
eukprot:CAMPEP_0178754350 /NCGR_PEP_ID=MMETSP0744-20121128/12109_1 /TAXON_ID=913974 /ORGANISM="Nitzschia punctata, Strain CCMP561" /LENGTH=48 /DNA_ID= /DNA_START= /DNA_END= /DNA_ORIENTATION=